MLQSVLLPRLPLPVLILAWHEKSLLWAGNTGGCPLRWAASCAGRARLQICLLAPPRRHLVFSFPSTHPLELSIAGLPGSSAAGPSSASLLRSPAPSTHRSRGRWGSPPSAFRARDEHEIR